MKGAIGLVLLLLFCVGCERSPYAGYKIIGDGVHLRLMAIGDGEDVPTNEDSLVLRLRMGQHNGEAGGIFSTERSYLVKDIRKGALSAVLHRLHVGDSMSVIAPVAAWPWVALIGDATVEVPDTGMVQVEILLGALRTPAMVQAELDGLKRNDPLTYELRLIQAYTERTKLPYATWGISDLRYTIAGKAVDTNAVVSGDQVTIAYKGRCVEDGRVFDDTDRNGTPFTFTYGERDQVIKGLEIAVSLLREGQEGTFILPSLYAFAQKGIPNVLDANMPVVYTVTLQKVVRGRKT